MAYNVNLLYSNAGHTPGEAVPLDQWRVMGQGIGTMLNDRKEKELYEAAVQEQKEESGGADLDYVRLMRRMADELMSAEMPQRAAEYRQETEKANRLDLARKKFELEKNNLLDVDDFGDKMRVLFQTLITAKSSPNFSQIPEEDQKLVNNVFAALGPALANTKFGKGIFGGALAPAAGENPASDPDSVPNQENQDADHWLAFNAELKNLFAKKGFSDSMYALDQFFAKDKRGKNSSEYKNAAAYLNNLQADANLEYARKLEREEIARRNAQTALDNDAKYEPTMKQVLDLEAGDPYVLRTAFNEFLYNLAGQNVKDAEIVRHISGVLKGSDRLEFEKKAKKAIAASAVPIFGRTAKEIMDSSIVSEYIGSIDPNLLAKALENKIPEKYSKSYRKRAGDAAKTKNEKGAGKSDLLKGVPHNAEMY